MRSSSGSPCYAASQQEYLVASGFGETVSVERTGAIELASLSCKTDDKMQIS